MADATSPVADHRYKWTALANTTMAMLVVTINSSIVIISLPAIFRGLGLDPLSPGNIGYLLWLLMGFMLVTAVLVVTFGRLGDSRTSVTEGVKTTGPKDTVRPLNWSLASRGGIGAPGAGVMVTGGESLARVAR